MTTIHVINDVVPSGSYISLDGQISASYQEIGVNAVIHTNYFTGSISRGRAFEAHDWSLILTTPGVIFGTVSGSALVWNLKGFTGSYSYLEKGEPDNQPSTPFYKKLNPIWWIKRLFSFIKKMFR